MEGLGGEYDKNTWSEFLREIVKSVDLKTSNQRACSCDLAVSMVMTTLKVQYKLEKE